MRNVVVSYGYMELLLKKQDVHSLFYQLQSLTVITSERERRRFCDYRGLEKMQQETSGISAPLK
jgi:hypothetical protein